MQNALFAEPTTEQQQPETLNFNNIDEVLKALSRLSREETTYQNFIDLRTWCIGNEALIIGWLSKKTIKELKDSFYTQRDKKDDIVKSAYDSILSCFLLGEGVTWTYGGKSYKDSRNDVINSRTAEHFETWKAEKIARRAAHKKALENPETLEEFRTFVRYKGEAALSTQQRAAMDELSAEITKGQKTRDEERRAHLTAVAVENADLIIQETVHTKKNIPLWVVRLSERVERHIYTELNNRAKRLGGYYSSYRGNGAVPGFTFEKKEAAELFTQIKEGDVNAVELRKAINAERTQERAENLQEKADNINERATESLNQDRKDNTVRRARIASSMERRAIGEIEFSLTLEKIGEEMAAGRIIHLNKLANITQLEELERILNSAKWKYITRNKVKEDHFEMCDEVIDFVEMPYPVLYKDTHYLILLKNLWNDPGKKLAAARMFKRFNRVQDGEFITMTPGTYLADYERLFCWTSKNLDKWDYQRFKNQFLRYKRIEALGITTIQELRAALRELLRIKNAVTLSPEQLKAQQLRECERKFVSLNMPGFFPTPEDLGAEVVELAEIKPGNTIAEPSAGLGHLAEVINDLYPNNDLQVIERYQPFIEVLKLKGFENAICTDFLSYENSEGFDRIIMNPPFEDLQDIEHVYHAFNLLKPGGRLVAIMAANKEGERDKVQTFRNFIQQYGYSKQNPQGSFSSAFRPTGVNTITVVIDKPE